MSKFDILSVALESKATIEKNANKVYDDGATSSQGFPQEVNDGIFMFVQEMYKRYTLSVGDIMDGNNLESFVIGMLNMCSIGNDDDTKLNKFNYKDTSFSGMVGDIDSDERRTYEWLGEVSKDYLKSCENVEILEKKLESAKLVKSQFSSAIDRCLDQYFCGEKVFTQGLLIKKLDSTESNYAVSVKPIKHYIK